MSRLTICISILGKVKIVNSLQYYGSASVCLYFVLFCFEIIQYLRSCREALTLGPVSYILLELPAVVTPVFTRPTLLLPSQMWTPVSLLQDTREQLTRSTFTLQNCVVFTRARALQQARPGFKPYFCPVLVLWPWSTVMWPFHVSVFLTQKWI